MLKIPVVVMLHLLETLWAADSEAVVWQGREVCAFVELDPEAATKQTKF